MVRINYKYVDCMKWLSYTHTLKQYNTVNITKGGKPIVMECFVEFYGHNTYEQADQYHSVTVRFYQAA